MWNHKCDTGSNCRKRWRKVWWVKMCFSSYSSTFMAFFWKHGFRGLPQWSSSFCDEAQKRGGGGVEIRGEKVVPPLWFSCESPFWESTICHKATSDFFFFTAISEVNTFQGCLGSLTAIFASTKQHSLSVSGSTLTFHEATERCLYHCTR